MAWCNGHGTCDRSSGVCVCEEGYADGEWEDTYTGPKRHVRVFDVVDGKALRGGRIFCEVDPANGVHDGIRTDTKGNLCATNPPSACLLIAPRLTGPACYADG